MDPNDTVESQNIFQPPEEEHEEVKESVVENAKEFIQEMPLRIRRMIERRDVTMTNRKRELNRKNMHLLSKRRKKKELEKMSRKTNR